MSEERDLKTISIAKDANDTAARALAISEEQTSAASASFEQERWAKWAAILAAIAAIIAAKDETFSIVSIESILHYLRGRENSLQTHAAANQDVILPVIHIV